MVEVSPTCFDYCPFGNGHKTMILGGRFESAEGRNNAPPCHGMVTPPRV